MGNILDYVNEYGGFTFVEKPFCEVDGLILSHLSYYVYDGIVPYMEEKGEFIYFKDILFKMDYQNFLSVTWELESNKELLYKVMSSRRYRNTRANYYVNEISEEYVVQFSAITFLLGDGEIFISMRGTDDTLVGWKEDFYMAYKTPVKAQERGVKYVNDIYKLLLKKKRKHFYLGGHSKGGNLAVYTAMKCDEKVRKKIVHVYNFDGPGFRPDFLHEEDFELIKEKVIKYVPEESVVGMLMEQRDDYCMIKSTEIGVAQHVTFSWCIDNDQFVKSDESIHKRKLLCDRINQWIFQMNEEQIGGFLDNLFKLVELTEVKSLSEIQFKIPDFRKKAHSIRNEYKNMDDFTKQIFWELCVFLIEVMVTDQHERMQKWKVIEVLRQKMERRM